MRSNSPAFTSRPSVPGVRVPAKTGTLGTCWIFVEQDKKGTHKQAEGLAKGLNMTPQSFFVRPSFFAFQGLPRAFWPLRSLAYQRRTPNQNQTEKHKLSDLLKQPMPACMIGAGRLGTLAAALLKRHMAGVPIKKLFQRRDPLFCRHTSEKPLPKTPFTIALLNPKLPCRWFDAIVAPRHDRLNCPNLVSSLLSPHPMTSDVLDGAKKKALLPWQNLPLPHIGILLGGSTKKMFHRGARFDKNLAADMAKNLRSIQRASGGTLLISPSRRTPPSFFTLLRQHLQGTTAFFLDLKTDSYAALLATSDALIVTADSTQMISEASATDVPLFIYPLPHLSSRLMAFQDSIYAQKIARRLSRSITYWHRGSENILPYLKQQLQTFPGFPRTPTE